MQILALLTVPGLPDHINLLEIEREPKSTVSSLSEWLHIGMKMIGEPAVISRDTLVP